MGLGRWANSGPLPIPATHELRNKNLEYHTKPTTIATTTLTTTPSQLVPASIVRLLVNGVESARIPRRENTSALHWMRRLGSAQTALGSNPDASPFGIRAGYD